MAKYKEFRVLLRNDEGSETTLVGDFVSYEDILDHAAIRLPDFHVVEKEEEEEEEEVVEEEEDIEEE